VTKLDDLDQKILAILEKNAREPLSQIAKRINRSRSAVQARVDKLEESGEIAAYTIRRAAPEHQGVCAIVTVYLKKRLEPGSVVELLAGFPEVTKCHRISGEADLLIELSNGPHDRIQEICKILWEHENVRLTETVFVMDTISEI
jgi:DNA-binding Lrp family transcriptional regulator